MNVSAAKARLQERQERLEALQGNREEVAGQVEALEAARKEAVKALTAGNEGKRGAVDTCEAKLKPLKTRLEGLDALLEDGKEEVAQAKEALREAEAKEAGEVARLVAEKLREQGQKIFKEAAGLVDKFSAAYVLAGQLAGQLRLSAFKAEMLRRRGLVEATEVRELEENVMGLPGRLDAILTNNGHRPLMAGFYGSIQVIPLVAPDLAGAFPGVAGINPVDFAEYLIDQETRELEEKYQKELNK